MERALLTLYGNSVRQKAIAWIRKAPDGTQVEFKAAKRTHPQNNKMWAALTDIADQVEWHGLKLTTTDWKYIFLDALDREVRIVPNLDNTGFVNLGRSSSNLTKEEMSGMIDLIHKFGARHGVGFRDMEAHNGQVSRHDA